MDAQVRASHILLKHTGSRNPHDSYRNKPITRSKAEAIAGIQQIREQIKSVEDFANIAQQISECRSAANGGDLGVFGRGDMQKAFEDATFALNVGEMSDLVDSDSGIHIILRTAFDEPIDAIHNKRGNRYNIRGAFLVLFIFVTGFTLLCVAVAKSIYHFRSKPEETGVEGHKFSDDLLDVIEYACEDYDDLFTLLQNIFLFLASLIYIKTKQYEEQESDTKNDESYRIYDTIENVDSMRNYQVQKAVQLIKDYKFKSYASVYIELIVLSVLCSAACTILNIPYVLLFLALILILGFNSSQKPLLSASQKMTPIFISLLLMDLPTKYVIKSKHYATEEGYDTYLTEAIGLISNTSTHLEFYFKIALYLIECQKINYIYNYQTIYDQIKQIHSDKVELTRLFRKRISFSFKFFKPIAIFTFCLFGVTFALLHPSIVLLAVLPLLIYGFFLNEIQFRGFAKMFIIIFALFNITAYGFRLVYILLPSSQRKENALQYIENIFGFRRTYTDLTDVFPGKLDFVFTMVMAFFSYVIQKIYRESLFDEQQRRQRGISRQGYDEDILTIPDNLSETYSRVSLQRPVGNSALSERSQLIPNRARTELPDPIHEESKEEDNEIESQRPHSSRLLNRRNHWHMQKDETMRGRMRRFCYKTYVNLKQGFEQLLYLLIIHSAKIAYLAIFVVSVLEANIVNSVLFIMFLAVSLMGFRTVRRFWKVTIIIDSLILIGMYVVDIFQNDFVTDISKTTQDIIGIQVNKSNETKLREYSPYLILLVVLVLTDYVLNSQRYQDFLEIYQRIEEQDENEDKDNQQDKKEDQDDQQSQKQSVDQEQVGVSDPISKLIIKCSIQLLIIALFFGSSILPVSILNAILLGYNAIIVYFYLHSETTIKMYQSLNTTLTFLKWTSILFISMKYSFQFQDYAEHVDEKSEEEMRTFYDELPLVRRLFGVENSHVPIKLLCLALVMSLTNYQQKYLSYKYLADILREQDAQWNRLYFWTAENQTKFKLRLHKIKVYFLFFAYYASLPLPLIFLFRYSLKYVSVIGFIIMILGVVIMYLLHHQFWHNQHKYLGIIASLLIMTDYGIQFIYLNASTNQGFIEWFGVEKQDRNETTLYDQLIPAFTILILCSVWREAFRLSNIFVVTVSQEDIDKAEEEELAFDKHEDDDKPAEDADKSGDEANKENDNQENKKIISEKLEKLKAIWEYEQPIRKCVTFKEDYLKILCFNFGYVIFLLVFFIVIFYKLNIVSVIYSCVLISLMRVNYYQLRFEENPQYTEKRLKAIYRLKVAIILISFFMIVQYFMLTGPAYEFDYTSWKDHFATYFCYKSNEECYADWKDFLSLTNIPKAHIRFDILLLFTCYCILFMINGQISLRQDQIASYPKIRDENDFLTEKQRNKFKNFLYLFIFNSFPYFFISYLLIFAATFHGAGATDLLSAVYLFFAMYYIIQFRKLYTDNSKLLKYLRNYNFVVLLALTIFQMPTFVCTAIEMFFEETHYIGREKCANLDLGNLERLDKSHSSWLAFYVVFFQSLGLMKIDSLQFDFVTLMILTEIQNHIFYHPYFQVYVLQHMKEDKETDGKLRAFMFVERSHLRLLWAYKAIKEEIKILHQRLVRVNKTIREQEFSRHLLDDNDDDPYERAHLLTDNRSDSNMSENLQMPEEALLIVDEVSSQDAQTIEEETALDKDIDKILEYYMTDLENICLDLISYPDTPVVPMKYFLETLKQHLKNNKDFLEMIKNGKDSEEIKEIIKEHLVSILKVLQRQIHQKDRLDLYYKEGLGLHFAVKKGSTKLMAKGDYKFYKHVILGEYIEQSENDKQQPELEEEKDQLQEPVMQRRESILETFEVKEVYDDLSVVQDKLHEAEYQKLSAWKKIQTYMRHYLWNNYVNKQMFYSITQGSDKDKQMSLDKIPFLRLFANCILTQSQNICYLVLFINFILNANLITLIPALTSLLYAMLDYPSANVKYWKYLMIYMLITVCAKFLYQLPIFCGTPAYEFYDIEACENYPVLPETLVKRIDYIIGVHKFAGPSSFPRDQGIVAGMIGDVLVLFTLMLLKNYMIRIGQWHFVKNSNNIYQNPSFKCKPDEKSEIERLNELSEENYRIYEYESANLFGKIEIRFKQAFKFTNSFLHKLLPTYMQPYQKNLDVRTQEEFPQIHHSAKKVKPGKSFFASNFFSLLLIFIFNLFWYRNVTGEDKSGSLANVSLDRFSILQVLLLFFLLLLMLVERMLYRVRYFDSSNSQVQSSILAKHQLTIKLGIYIFLVIGVHMYLGFIIKRSYFDGFFKKFPVIVSYLLWIYHLVSSALQIRYGYPQNAFKPPFTRDTSQLKVLAFRVYKALPFLWEMKVIIDWTVTSTCLDLFQWFKLDDAFNYLYANQFQNDDRRNRPEYGQRQWKEKFFMGFCFAFFLILIILAPILLFSGINPILVNNPVESGQLQISFELNSNGITNKILSSQAFNIRNLYPYEVDRLKDTFVPINVKYADKNLQFLRFSPYSEEEWQISPPSLQKFIADFNANKNNADAYIDIKSTFTFRRGAPVGAEDTQTERSIRISASKLLPIVQMLSNTNQPRLDSLLPTLPGASSDVQDQGSVFVPNIFPKIFRLGAQSKSSSLEVQTQQDFREFSSAYLTLKRTQDGGLYWTYQLLLIDQKGLFEDKDRTNNDQTKDHIIITFNDEVIGSFLGSSFEFSIVGLYATIVIAIGRFLRIIFDRISQRVIYEEMPDQELLMEICEGIFIAQLEGDLVREKRLYDLLIRLYRSPETLIKITGARLRHNRVEKNSKQQQQQNNNNAPGFSRQQSQNIDKQS